jgi:hypothetical protein
VAPKKDSPTEYNTTVTAHVSLKEGIERRIYEGKTSTRQTPLNGVDVGLEVYRSTHSKGNPGSGLLAREYLMDLNLQDGVKLVLGMHP